MKKFIVFMLVLACVCSTFALKKQTIFQMPGVETVCLVAGKSYKDFATETVQSGDLVFNFCSLQVAEKNIGKVKDLETMQFYFSSTSVDEILEFLNATKISEEKLENLIVINAYTPLQAKCVYVQNKKVNVQIALRENRVIAGFPVLLTGY